ncbi:MAG: GntR family transcriptional regulator [Burkholderiaceae bacterium]|jgi:GntR family transcriptional regulator|nr:GntR family transcriptional regulator [Burkholderiaceae bacterium]MDO7578699.1 GntR family transcriptional regulator [Burkholderiaceae bacterium]
MSVTMPLPKYHQVYLVLRERLLEAGSGSTFPSEFELMDEFKVARVTIRRALSNLVSEGLISRRAGRGTTVRAAPGRLSDSDATNASADLLANLVHVSLGTKARVISIENVLASDGVASALQLDAHRQVQKAVRVRSTKNGPVSHITTFVPQGLATAINRQQLAKKPILTLLEESGLTLGKAQQNVSAKLADASVADLLGVSVGSALLSVRRLVFDANERPIQLLFGLYRPDRYEYQMKLSRMGGVDARVWVDAELAANVL